ncbi:MAG: hypothetical protein LBS11_10550, partial [Oscillospiraceae bacterium]|nr:hypothetical protein [Oscillospiraceae bacterium]
MGGALRGGRRKADAVAFRDLLTLDLDDVPEGGAAGVWSTVELAIGRAAVMYSTHSHTPERPRLRLIMPLARPVKPDEYAAIARRIAADIGIDMCDDTTYEAHRLMYWPSTPRDGEYVMELQDGPWLEPDEILNRYLDWRDASLWPDSRRCMASLDRLAAKAGDPLEKPGVVGAFCRVYGIEGAIAKFLPRVYSACDAPGRYSYVPGDSSAGLVVYDDGRFAYSHHATDPAGGRLSNAFDLTRLHLYGSMDDSVPEETPINRLPSYLAMTEMAANDDRVKLELGRTRLASAAKALDDSGDAADDEWIKRLSLTSKGRVAPTIENCLLILQHDPELGGRIYYDAFRERPAVCGDLPWRKLSERLSNGWTDVDEAGVWKTLELKYGVDSSIKIRAAMDLAIQANSRHPIREYLYGLKWDGVARLETLFIEYLCAEDS